MRYTRNIKLVIEAQDESEANDSFLHAEIQIAKAMTPFSIKVERHYEEPLISVVVARDNAANSIGSGMP